MGNPSAKEISVALEAIRDDAKKWDDAAQQTEQISNVCKQLTLESIHFSYIGNKLGLTDVYTGIQEKITNLASEAAQNFSALAKTLNDCANDYESTDQSVAESGNKIRQEIPSW